MDMGQKIKALRKEKGLTQEQLGDIVGVQKSAVAKWERGAVTGIRRDTFIKLADTLGVTTAYFWDNTPLKTEEHTLNCNDYGKIVADNIVLLMNYFKELDEDGRCKLLDYAEYLTEKHKK